MPQPEGKRLWNAKYFNHAGDQRSWTPTASNFFLSQKLQQIVCWRKLKAGKLFIWPQRMLRHDVLEGKPRLAAAANSNSGRARSRVCFDLPSFDLRPFGLFVVARSARGHLGSSQKEKMRFNALKPTNNPQWVPLSPSPESFFMAPRTVRQRRQAAGGWSLASTRLVCIKWIHVVFVSWSAADTNS